jgi:hypothetical protein
MKTQMQHFFHPLNLWCRVGGKFTFVFRLYETCFWQPFLRRWFGLTNTRDTYFLRGDKEVDKGVCSIALGSGPER